MLGFLRWEMRGRSLWHCSYYASDVYGMGKDKVL